MEFIGITRLVEGKEVNQFVATCPDHNYYYKGKPPITHGCRECWTAFYVSEWARAGAKKEHVDQLEDAIHHAAELASKGEFDFVPKLEDFKITHED
jgi:hypothetical protein